MVTQAMSEPAITAPSVAPSSGYRWSLAGFVVFFAIILLGLVDVRRGFLFASYPIRSPYAVFSPWQVLVLAVGLLGAISCYLRIKRDESRTGVMIPASYVKGLTLAILGLLIVDLFTYRGVPAARSLASGTIGTDWLRAFGVTAWFRPIALATSYLLNVWHATLLGVLISGLALAVLPVYLTSFFARTGFTGSLFGALFALPQPFCSCCSSVMAPSLTRRGASTNFLLSFVVGAPTLNVTTLVLAVALLPTPFAITRIVAGFVVAVLVTYLVARVADDWGSESLARQAPPSRPNPIIEWSGRAMNFYFRLFDLDTIVGGRKVDTPAHVLSTWLYASGRIALVLVPTLWIWSVVASGMLQVLPSAFGNNLSSVVLAAVGGTLLMISTWSEIPMALQLIHAGFNGPAAALLVVLPPVSLPCLMLLGGALGRFRMVALLAVAIALVGVIVGVLFL